MPRKIIRSNQMKADLRDDPIGSTIIDSGQHFMAMAWINALPKTPGLTMAPAEFSFAIRSRCLVPHPFISLGLTCSCGKPMDILGVHTQKCRKYNALTIATHDAIVDDLQELYKYCGYHAKKEVHDTLRQFKPDDARICDLVISEPAKKRICIDVRITNPVTSKIELGTMRGRKIPEAGTAAETNAKQKDLKYKNDIEAIGMEFIPFVLETTGRPSKGAQSLIENLINKKTKESGIPSSVLTTYWARRLGCTLQKMIANAVITKCHREVQRGGLAPSQLDEANFDDVILDQDESGIFFEKDGWNSSGVV